jgi:nucleoside-diphosphate-sugar epimerase
VIGGAGLLGYEIASQLHEQGKYVRILDPVSAHDSRFEEHTGDIRYHNDLRKACSVMDIVFQTAAAVWDPKMPPHVYDEVNIEGNASVINTCIAQGIKKLVYTSTMDVVVDGRKPIVDGNESLPYPEKMPADPYCRTKIIAEQMVLKANCPQLLTCSLRPVGMYGPRDKYHITNIIKAVSNGINIRPGNGTAKFSHVYSGNAAHAHILAAKHLYHGSPVAGNTYFITDDYPAENLFDFMEPFLAGLGLEPPKKSIPYHLAYFLSSINEKINPSSNFNRFAIIQTCVDHTFVSSRAEQDFGYRPPVPREEAFKKTLDWFLKNIDNIL